MKKKTVITALILTFSLVFSVCASAYTCSGKYDICPMEKYSDLPSDIWCHEGLDFVISRGYMVGKSETHFVPNGSMTRAMVVTVLYRIADDAGAETDKASSLPFSDAPKNAWFYDALCWAYKHDIAKGFSETKFGPNMTVTREQITLFLSRFASFSGESVTARGDIGIFNDVSGLSSESRKAISWAVGEGILYGYSNGEFRPKNLATRAHFAVMLQRWLGDSCTQHSYGLKEVTLKPTCTENGRYERVCSVCGHKEIGVISAMGHSYGDMQIGTAPTCIKTGTYVKVCRNCGDAEVIGTVAMTAHSYTQKIVKEPSCIETGTVLKTCTVCGKTVSESVPMTEHKFINGKCSCGVYEKTAIKVTSLNNDDKVIIYNPACKYAMGTASVNNKLACVSVSVSGNRLGYATNDTVAVLSVEKSGSGFYLKNSAGRYLTTSSEGYSLFFSNDKSNALWVLDGGKIINSTVTSGDTKAYIECYADCFTCYGYSSRYDERYIMELYKVT